MNLEIITPDTSLFNGEIVSARFPGTDGSFGVLKDHAPLIATLQKGEILVSENSGQKSFEINGGIIEVRNNTIIVLAS